ncbi:hypothetical protein FRB93_005719 [Tulasnella sp. JGI-2019a]|nr:hypothetical protein FRB93_005719 [Tulasnella sp. JGI-2019a]
MSSSTPATEPLPHDPVISLNVNLAQTTLASNQSPCKPAPAHTKANEMKDIVDNDLFPLLHKNVFEVEPESFLSNLLYKPNDISYDRNVELAEGCFKAMVSGNKEWTKVRDGLLFEFNEEGRRSEKRAAESLINGTIYNTELQGFTGLQAARGSKEKPVYRPAVTLFSFIQEWYAQHEGSGDENWPAAIDVTAEPPRPFKNPRRSMKQAALAAPSQLKRAFVNNHNFMGDFTDSRSKPTPLCAPDISLILYDPRKEEAKPSRAWKDIKVAFEAKSGDASIEGVEAATQAARYARAMKIEQFDRKFQFTVTISPIGCRVWRWDTAACHVSEFLNFGIKEHAIMFIHLIGRFATMDPESLGYDMCFSNAGTVLGHQADHIKTTLTIKPDVAHNAESRAPVAVKKGEELVYVVEHPPIYQARDRMFNRSTTVWRAYLQREGPESPRHIITQKWQDRTRFSEAYFCTLANEVKEGVAHMLYSQQLDNTEDYHKGLNVKKVWHNKTLVSTYDPAHSSRTRSLTTGSTRSDRSQESATSTSKREFRAKKIDEPEKPRCERSLLRLVFKDVGKPLRFAEGPKKLMCLWNLWERLGLIHRDVAPGNFLMNVLENAPEGMRGFVIDLGLSVMMRSDKNAHLLQNLVTAVHDHRTGTLPFMATQLLQDSCCEHGIHHDLEAVFWLLLCECLQAAREYQEDLAQPLGGFTEQMMESMPGIRLLEKLRDPDPDNVVGAKLRFLGYPEINIQLYGRHAALQPFLIEYAELCYESSRAKPGKEEKLLTFEKVVELMKRTIAKLPDDLSTLPSSTATPARASTLELGPGSASISGSKRLHPPPTLTEGDKKESKRLKSNRDRPRR